jgi:hypothetical protein
MLSTDGFLIFPAFACEMETNALDSKSAVFRAVYQHCKQQILKL